MSALIWQEKHMILVLQKKSKIQSALFQNSKTYLVEEETVARKDVLLMRITNQETTDKLNSMISYFIKRKVQPWKENSLLLLISFRPQSICRWWRGKVKQEAPLHCWYQERGFCCWQSRLLPSELSRAS